MARLSAPKPIQSSLAGCRCGAFLQERQQPDRGQDAERDVDVEDPAPAVIVGQPAAQDRAADRPHHHTHGPQPHRLGALLRWIEFVHHRLRQRHQRGAEHALQDPEHHDLAERLRQAAQGRGDGKADDGSHEQPRAAKARARKPVGAVMIAAATI